jgi:hypothetical protein
MSVGFHP